MRVRALLVGLDDGEAIGEVGLMGYFGEGRNDDRVAALRDVRQLQTNERTRLGLRVAD